MTLDALAEKYRLKITRDECNHKVVLGRRGHLYVDAGKVCAMWLDARVSTEKLQGLGAKVWVGDFTLDLSRPQRPCRLRDAKVTGIPPENRLRAIRLTGCRRGPEMTDEQREARRTAMIERRAAMPERFKPKKEPT